MTAPATAASTSSPGTGPAENSASTREPAPCGEGLGNGTASVIIGTGWTRSHRPLLTAFPDAGSDGKADIFATGGDDKLYLYSNLSGSGVAVGTSGWLDFQALS